jgi:hypothetical protein
MPRRPTRDQLIESIHTLKAEVPDRLYPHVWTLIYEIEALQAEVDNFRKVFDGKTRIVVSKNGVPIIDLDGVTLNVEK